MICRLLVFIPTVGPHGSVQTDNFSFGNYFFWQWLTKLTKFVERTLQQDKTQVKHVILYGNRYGNTEQFDTDHEFMLQKVDGIISVDNQ